MSAIPVIHRVIDDPVQRFLSSECDAAELSKRIKAILEFQSQNLPSQIAYSNLLSKLLSSGLDLLNYNDPKDIMRYKMAGLVIFDCLLDINDEIMPERRIEISNHICKVLENDKNQLSVHEVLLRTASASIGHFARVATTGEVEFLQNFYFPRSLQLISNNRSETLRFSGALILTQLAQNSPALIFAKRKTLFNVIWDAVSDKNAMVRSASTATLEASLSVISQRESMTDYVRAALRQIDLGLTSNAAEKIIGSLTILDTMVGGVAVDVADLHAALRQQGAQLQDIVWRVLQRKDWKDHDVRLKIMEIIPNLASAFGNAFLQPNTFTAPHNFLTYSVKHLTDVVHSKKDRSFAFRSLGRLFQAMSFHFRSTSLVHDVFDVVFSGFLEPFCVEALSCVSILVSISPLARKLVDIGKVEFMFRGGLSKELVETLKVVVKHVAVVRRHTQSLLRTHVSATLSYQPLCLDESRRPSSLRFGSSIPRESKGYIGSIFGSSMKPNETFVDVVVSSSRPEDALIFALNVLTIGEFFPKQLRERVGGEDDEIEPLLMMVRESVIRYVDDFCPSVRKAAVQACAAVADVIVLAVEPDSEQFLSLLQILDRLLLIGVGDDCQDIRKLVFNSITPSMDHAVSMTDTVHCLMEALNDESLDVRAAAMTVLARVARYDTLHVLPVVRLTLKRLLYTLNNTSDHLVKQESVQILQALVRGSDVLIVPYVKQIIGPLMTLLSDPSAEVVVAALTTVGELALASPVSVREHMDDLAPRMIDALNDRTSIAKQETAVIAMGKLVSTLTMVTEEPYKQYSGLFEGLVKAVQNVDESSFELRLQAMKTLGLLGSVDGEVYQRHLASSNPVLNAFSTPTDGFLLDQNEDFIVVDSNLLSEDKKLSKIEKHYASVVIRELMNALKDSTLSQHHQSAAGIAMKIIRTLGSQTVYQFDELMQGFLFRLYQTDSGNNIKDALLDHLITLVHIMKKNTKMYSSKLVKLMKDFFDTHLQMCLDLFEALGLVLPYSEFCFIEQNILPLLYKTVEDENSLSLATIQDVSGNSKSPHQNYLNSSKTVRILQKIAFMSEYLGEYRRDLISFVIKILDHENCSSEVRKEALCTAIHLSKCEDTQEFAARLMQPLIRLINVVDVTLTNAVVTGLSSLLCRLGIGFVPFIVPIRRKLKSLSLNENGTRNVRIDEYESLVARLLKQRPLPTEPSDISEISIKLDERSISRSTTAHLQSETSFQINTQSLETAWALADKGNATNLIEWMRRLAIELIRQSPSLIIRSCATLAKAHRPLAEELFNSSFHSIWEDLFSSHIGDVVVNNSLVSGIEMALSSPQIPKNMLASLLNLAEFMDIQDRPLPIDIRLLAQQTQVANMFAKCLRYREMEFNTKNVTPSFECIDALISVNNQLGLSDRAIGVLRYLRVAFPHIDIQPQWLEKLCRWDDAYRAYEVDIKNCKEQFKDDLPIKHDRWLQSELGRLRCLQALGEFEELESKARALKDVLKNCDDMQDFSLRNCVLEVQRLGANAAWMLRKWNAMEDFLEGESKGSEVKDVVLENNLSFYSAILAIQNQDYVRASSLITDTRNSLSGSISSLFSESYSRAHRAMVTMQILAEMEEVIEYKQIVHKVNLDHEKIKSNSSDLKSLHLDGKRDDQFVIPANAELHSKKQDLVRKWRARLKWAPKDVEVYRQILASIFLDEHLNRLFFTLKQAVHSLVAEPEDDLDSWLELVTLCRKEGMNSLCANILRKLGAPLPLKRSFLHSFDAQKEHVTQDASIAKPNDRVLFSTFQYWWSNGEKQRALGELTNFLKTCFMSQNTNGGKDSVMFRVRCLLKRATWMRELEDGDVGEILETLREARDLAENEYSVWHAWAVANYDQLKRTDAKELRFVVDDDVPLSPLSYATGKFCPLDTPPHHKSSKLSLYSTPKKLNNGNSSGSASLLSFINIHQADKAAPYVVEGIKGFVRSIVLGQGQPVANLLQDTLRLITLWFSYGVKKGVLQILESELEKISPDNWLGVIPQLIARIHIKSTEISGLLRKLLVKVAAAHPQALVCPISVALNTNDNQQRLVASEVLAEVRKIRKELVEDATLFSTELMRVAITPHELWYDGLEQAAQSYMDNKDIAVMISSLRELHETLNDYGGGQFKKNEGFSESLSKVGHVTLRDVSFRHNYGKSLQDAQFWLDLFRNSGRSVDLHQAWEIYQAVFKKIKVQIGMLKKIELHHVSPSLTTAKNLSLAVPGTYKPGWKDVCITSFTPTVHVIASKQRPRRMSMVGSNGETYQFLLKGHEDLRQDERVMQLFGLINVCLKNDRITNEKSLNIVRYSVLPLSNNSGVIGWVENCDTINQLVKQYREAKDIRLLIELKLLQSKCANYDKLPLIHKVDIFRQVLEETTGDDLTKMLWLQSKTSDVWIERRANFIRSLAVMSMVGYILGLGDRHPSNLMLHQISGQVVHIDFGDCFEITAHRAKYPEIIPFRLTRMLTKCMELAGIQGTYRITCERVMRVLRENRDSVMAMLEAFVYDPLISWRLLADGNNADILSVSRVNSGDDHVAPQKSPVEKMREQLTADNSLLTEQTINEFSPKRVSSSIRDMRRAKSKEVNGAKSFDVPLQNNLNTRALEVINRIQAKLTGRDFLRIDDEESDDFTVEEQVDRLIKEATSIENLCQLFTGWCPLW